MIITCPSCKARFLLENQNLHGKRLHCNRCGNLWSPARSPSQTGGGMPWRYPLLLSLLALSGLLIWAMIYPDLASYSLSYLQNGLERTATKITIGLGRYL